MYEVIRYYRQIESISSVASLPWWLTGSTVDLSFFEGRYYDGTSTLTSPTSLITTSRASAGYATNANGTSTLFGNDTPRIGLGTGLLVEEARTNLVLQSNTLNVTWTIDEVTAVQNAVDVNGAPNNAWTVTDTVTNIQHRFYQSIGASGGSRSYSIIAKAGTASFICISATGDGSSILTVDLSSGTIFGGFTNMTNTSVTPLANGFYLIKGTDNNHGLFFVLTMGTTSANCQPGVGYAGTGSTVIVQFIQAEDGAFATSYIPTTTVAVTRAADLVSLTGAALTTVKLAAASSFIKAGPTPNGPPSPGLITSTPIDQRLPYINGGNTAQAGMYNGSVVITATGADFAVASVKAACSWDGSGRSVVNAGGTITTDANTQISDTSYILGQTAAGVALDGYIQRVAFWNSRLADATLQALTA